RRAARRSWRSWPELARHRGGLRGLAGGGEVPEDARAQPRARDLWRQEGIFARGEALPHPRAELEELLGRVDDGQRRLVLHEQSVQLAVRGAELARVGQGRDAVEQLVEAAHVTRAVRVVEAAEVL